jgi:hypothetical protein
MEVPTCRRWDISYTIERGLRHGQCNICRSWDIRFKDEHSRFCYRPVTGRSNPYWIRPSLPIVNSVPNHPFPRRMSDEEEQACQRILHPAMSWNLSPTELVGLDRINQRNLRIREARCNVGCAQNIHRQRV